MKNNDDIFGKTLTNKEERQFRKSFGDIYKIVGNRIKEENGKIPLEDIDLLIENIKNKSNNNDLPMLYMSIQMKRQIDYAVVGKIYPRKHKISQRRLKVYRKKYGK